MVIFNRLVEIGRVVLIDEGKFAGKVAAIVEVIDGNRALVDGPCSEVARHSVNFRNMQLTKWVLPIRHGARTATVKKAWEAAKLSGTWANSAWAKKIKLRTVRATLTDFDRFKLMKAKQMRNRIVRSEFNKLKKKSNAAATKKPAPKKAKKAAPAKKK